MILFVREQSGGSPVRHKFELGRASSSWYRPESEVACLADHAAAAVIFELQGALFFGNTYRLYADLEHEIRERRFVVIDFRRVPSIDVTAIQIFLQVRQSLRRRGATLVLCGIRRRPGRGRSLSYLVDRLAPATDAERCVIELPDLDSATAWVECRILAEHAARDDSDEPMSVAQMDLFAGYRDDTLSDLEAHMRIRSHAAGETVYARGSAGDELFWVRRGAVSLVAGAGTEAAKQVAGFGRGDFFGGLSFLDRKPRPNDAVAMTDVELYVLTRADFDKIAVIHRQLALNLASAMARTLAMRLRRTEAKLAAFSD